MVVRPSRSFAEFPAALLRVPELSGARRSFPELSGPLASSPELSSVLRNLPELQSSPGLFMRSGLRWESSLRN
eukprot:11224622-Alexandrium_andersonii.AAC.1